MVMAGPPEAFAGFARATRENQWDQASAGIKAVHPGSTEIIQCVPKRSFSMPNRREQKVAPEGH